MPAAAPLRARGLEVSRGPNVVLDAVDLVVADGDRIGLVGPNGVGKSTLLAGARRAGRPRPRPRRADPADRHRRLPAAGARPVDDETVRALLARRTGVTAANAELDAATAALAAGMTPAPTTATTRPSTAGWPSAPPTSTPASARCGPSSASPPPCSTSRPRTLSGGEAARAGLAALLLARFDVFLLDEPTNDLDLDGLARLERWIGGAAGGRRARQPRPHVPRPHGHRRRRARRVHPPGNAGSAAAGRPTSTSAPPRERAAWERFEEYDTKRTGLAAARPAGAGVGDAGPLKGEAPARTSPTRTSATSASTRPSSSPARAARTERAMERLEVVDKPREPWQLRLELPTAAAAAVTSSPAVGLVADRVDAAAVHARTDRPHDRRRRARRPRRAPTARARRRCSTSCSARSIRPPARSRRGPGVVVGEIEQARDQLVGPHDRCCVRSRTPRAWTPPTPARCSPSSASSPTT